MSCRFGKCWPSVSSFISKFDLIRFDFIGLCDAIRVFNVHSLLSLLIAAVQMICGFKLIGIGLFSASSRSR